MKQQWHDLLFAHWRVPAESLRAVMPPQIPVDEFDGSAWIGVTPFEVRGFRPRLLPPPPRLSRFLECNVRTYTTIGGKPGIWFFSLDAESRFAVRGARTFWRLPYFLAEMEAGERYRTRRVSEDGPAAELEIAYEPSGDVFHAEPGTLDHFLAERYCLYTLNEEGEVLRGDIDHPPWPLQPATAEIFENTMGEQIGVSLTGDPLLHFAARQDVVFWTI